LQSGMHLYKTCTKERLNNAQTRERRT